jgi:uncharacterized membrane protein
MKRIRLFMAGLALLFGISALAPVAVLADTPQSTVCQSLGSNDTCSTDPSGGASLGTIAKDAVNILSLIVGIAAVIMVIVGGFRYVTSGGDSNSVSGAKNTIIYAVVGLAIVAAAQFIVQFVVNKV